MGEKPTRQQMLDGAPCFNPTDAAYILDELVTKGRHRGQPNARAVRDLIRAGKLALVDPDTPPSRWTVTRESIRARLAGQRIIILHDTLAGLEVLEGGAA